MATQAKKETKEVKELSVEDIINQIKPHPYYRDFLRRKYKGKRFTETEWKKNIKSDGL